ncbi:MULTISPECIES: lactate permease LctP family transporter [unclassified Bacillus (in: firmicutes)]|uniref:lactate permease LctP family transporter n=1 Tax=unclassified Bacillus (in: firmicutes) TaxID=185979 RepID=UPI000BEFD38D|nr:MULTISPECIES: lactate permease LctP family transporter [unclassified Bacillus (in: firmicutes)]PEJ60595.1 L-lactate permease [Bacillus sp. AFS002410]PEL09895.1 L-lactate permease [Bacillus sp. AFS017336]
MSTWSQIYNPLHNIWLSALMAAIPIIFFIIALTVLKLRGYIAGALSIIVAGIVAVLVYGMPIKMIVSSAVYGILAGIWPVASIVLAAIFLYKLTTKTGQFSIIRKSIASITEDQRIQVLLVAYSFGAFLEGAAGFGAPVAITAAILVGLGFNALNAAAICLIANIAGGAFGAMGIPVNVPAQLTGLDGLTVGRYTALVLPLVSILVPFLLVFIIDGFKGIRQTLPAILVNGISFAITQFAVLYFLGAELADIFAAIISLVAVSLFLRIWSPKEIYKIQQTESKASNAEERYSFNQIIYAWLPFILLTVFVTIFNLNFIKALFAPGGALAKLVFLIPVPALNNLIIRKPPIVPTDTPYAAVYKLDLFSSTVTAIVLAAILTIIIFKCNWNLVKETASETFKELISPILTICSVLAFAYICTYSGMSSTLGLAFASTGDKFPLFSPILGWIGVFLTGSVVNSGSLFAPLQAVTAAQIGILPETMVAVNVMGGTMAKMISPQSVAVATAAVGLVGQESKLFKMTVKYSLSLLVLIGIVSWTIF